MENYNLKTCSKFRAKKHNLCHLISAQPILHIHVENICLAKKDMSDVKNIWRNKCKCMHYYVGHPIKNETFSIVQ